MSNELRGTGRSQRGIVRALSLAIMGQRVLFVSANPESGRAHWRVACDWLGANGFLGYTGCEVGVYENRIRMGVGSVTFSMGKSMSGPGLHCIQHIVEDHFVTECNAAKAEQDRISAEMEEDKNTIATLMLKHKWFEVHGYGVTLITPHNHRTKVRLNLQQRTSE